MNYPAIGVGSGYQYHLAGGPAATPIARIALPSLRRRVGVNPSLRVWLDAAIAKARAVARSSHRVFASSERSCTHKPSPIRLGSKLPNSTSVGLRFSQTLPKRGVRWLSSKTYLRLIRLGSRCRICLMRIRSEARSASRGFEIYLSLERGSQNFQRRKPEGLRPSKGGSYEREFNTAAFLRNADQSDPGVKK